MPRQNRPRLCLRWGLPLSLLELTTSWTGGYASSRPRRSLQGSDDLRRCTFRIRTPEFNLSAPPPRPGGRFTSAQVSAPECGAPYTRTPAVALLPDDDAQPWGLTLTLNLRQTCEQTVPWSDVKSLVVGQLQDGWTHFAGDSLLRCQFQTLANWLAKRGVEPWKGASSASQGPVD